MSFDEAQSVIRKGNRKRKEPSKEVPSKDVSGTASTKSEAIKQDSWSKWKAAHSAEILQEWCTPIGEKHKYTLVPGAHFDIKAEGDHIADCIELIRSKRLTIPTGQVDKNWAWYVFDVYVKSGGTRLPKNWKLKYVSPEMSNLCNALHCRQACR
jgi:hypothetical protein